jgi:hypothetical protein
MLFTYGRFLSRELVNTVTSDHLLFKLVSGLIKYQMFICYFLYTAGKAQYILLCANTSVWRSANAFFGWISRCLHLVGDIYTGIFFACNKCTTCTYSGRTCWFLGKEACSGRTCRFCILTTIESELLDYMISDFECTYSIIWSLILYILQVWCRYMHKFIQRRGTWFGQKLL